jgi:hypothetical protein
MRFRRKVTVVIILTPLPPPLAYLWHCLLRITIETVDSFLSGWLYLFRLWQLE